MNAVRPHRGPELPYKLLAGVVPCPVGWLVAPGKLIGVNLFPETPEVAGSLRDVLDHIPSFTVIALAAPIGLPDEPHAGGRVCDREARRLLRMPRRGSILAAPCRKALAAATYEEARLANGGHLDVVTWLLMPRLREVAEEIQPYWQRTVFEVCPELSLYQLNDDVPMAFRKRGTLGQFERQAVLRARMPGCERVLEAHVVGARQAHLTDACAALWTARRIVARGISRVPEDPQWSSDGLRMEIVR